MNKYVTQLGLAWLTLFLFMQIAAQDSLIPNFTVMGEITADSTQSWRFSGLRDEVYSFIVEAEGDLDPVITIRNENGTEIIANDDYNYPQSRDALLEAITLPATGNYELMVSGYGGSEGDYTLTMQHGYADSVMDATFSSSEGWVFDDVLTNDADDGMLNLSLEGIQTEGTVTNSVTANLEKYYAQVTLGNVMGNNGWQIGLALLQQPNGERYLLEFDQRGQWRFVYDTSETIRPITNWTTHPAIMPGELNFTIGVLVNKGGFDVYYNGQLMNRIDAVDIDQPGAIGLYLQTPNAANSTITATFSDLLITAPLQADGAFIFPERLVQGNSTLLVEELERRHVIPTNGNLVLSIDSAFVEFASPGDNVLTLGRGAVFRNFVIGATTSLQSIGEGTVACGLLLRYADADTYTVAYLDNAGNYGVSERDGATFSQGMYGESDLWDANETNNLLVVLNDALLHYFINGFHVGTLEIDSVDGEIGNVLLNFDPIETTCQFDDIWLWSWE